MRTRRHVSVETISYKEVIIIQSKVAKRDDYRCVLCDHLGIAVHEILQKSSGAALSKRTYQMKYMGSLCLEHHHAIHNTRLKNWLNARIMIVLRERHHYKYSKGLNKFLDKVSWYLAKHPMKD